MLKNILFTALLSLLFLTACSTKEELAIVNEKWKYGASKSDDEISIKPIYDGISNFDDANNKNTRRDYTNVLSLHWLHNYSGAEYAIVEYRGKKGIITKDNKMVVKPIYDSITKLFNDFFIIKLDNKYGYMNSDFEVVQKPIFKNAREFLTDITFVQSNSDGKWSCITKDMELKDSVYDEVYNFSNGFAKVLKNSKWGYIDSSCKILVDPQYDYVYNFNKGYGKVIKNGKILYINTDAEEVPTDVVME